MKTLTPKAEQVTRIVKCPSCHGDSVYAPDNAFRPFCCERCQQIDFGAWASEQFAMPAAFSLVENPTDDN